MDRRGETITAAQFHRLVERVEWLEAEHARMATIVQPISLKFELDRLDERKRAEDILCQASEELSRKIMAARGVVDE